MIQLNVLEILKEIKDSFQASFIMFIDARIAHFFTTVHIYDFHTFPVIIEF